MMRLTACQSNKSSPISFWCHVTWLQRQLATFLKMYLSRNNTFVQTQTRKYGISDYFIFSMSWSVLFLLELIPKVTNFLFVCSYSCYCRTSYDCRIPHRLSPSFLKLNLSCYQECRKYKAFIKCWQYRLLSYYYDHKLIFNILININICILISSLINLWWWL